SARSSRWSRATWASRCCPASPSSPRPPAAATSSPAPCASATAAASRSSGAAAPPGSRSTSSSPTSWSPWSGKWRAEAPSRRTLPDPLPYLTLLCIRVSGMETLGSGGAVDEHQQGSGGGVVDAAGAGHPRGGRQLRVRDPAAGARAVGRAARVDRRHAVPGAAPPGAVGAGGVTLGEGRLGPPAQVLPAHRLGARAARRRAPAVGDGRRDAPSRLVRARRRDGEQRLPPPLPPVELTCTGTYRKTPATPSRR